MPTLHLHGIPRLVRPDQADLPLSAREAALLAWVHLEGPTPRERLAGLLWPAGDQAKARANLRQTLARLRRAAGTVLAESAGVLQLDPALAVAAPADPAQGPDGGDPQASAPAQRLLGPLEFDDAPEFAEWLQSRREAAVREQRRQRLSRARDALETGALDRALALAEQVLALDPAVEEAHRLRMEVFYLRGDRAASITAWDDCRDALRQAYGIGPSAATNELGRLVLAAEAASAEAARGAQAAQQAHDPQAAALPAALRRPPQRVGRAATWATLLQALAAGQGVVLAGPGGIGKSRLLADAAAVHEPALLVGARPGDVHLPGVVVSRLVAAAVDRFTPSLDSATRHDIALLLPGGPARQQALRSALEHRRVLASVARALHACQARGMRLLVVDDLHHADDLSMEALAVVVGRWLTQSEPGIALPLVACRPDELRPAAATLVQLLAASPRTRRIDLAPLDGDEVRALLQSLPLATGWAIGSAADAAAAGTVTSDPSNPATDAAPGGAPGNAPDLAALAQALHQRVGGNPAFVLESLRALWAQGPQALAGWRAGQPLAVPATLLEALRQRLARLSADALQLAQLAAVAQEDFSLALAASALGRPALALAPLFAELEAAQVLEGVRFSHDLVAEAALAALPKALLAPLHQLVAEHLRAQDGAAARIAWHLQQAGDAVAAAPWHLRAGRAARERWQLAQAARSFEAAALGLELQRQTAGAGAGAGPEDSVPATWLQAARWWTAVSEYAAALRALDRGAAAGPTPAERLELAASRVVVLLNSQRTDEACAVAAGLAAQLQADRQPGAQRLAQHDAPPGVPASGSARAQAQALPPAPLLAPDRLAAALFACVAVAPYSAEPQFLAALCEAQRAHCEAGPAPARLSFHLAAGTCLNWLAWPARAWADLLRAQDLASVAGDHGSLVNVSHQALRNALMMGDGPRAQAAARAGSEAVKAGGYGRSFVLHAQAAEGLAALAAGAPAPAWVALQALQRAADAEGLAQEPEVAAVLALLGCALGCADQAATGTPAADGWVAFAHWRLATTPTARQAALAAMAQRWPAEDGVMGWRRRVLAARTAPPALPAAQALVQALRERQLWPLVRQAHLVAARAACAAGDHPEAVAQARAALALTACVDPWTDEAAAVWPGAAAVLQAAGASAEAAAALQAGRQWVLAAADRLPAAAERRAWCEGVAAHRALLAVDAGTGGPQS